MENDDDRFNKMDKNTQIGIVMRQTNYTIEEIALKFTNPKSTYMSIIFEYLNVVKKEESLPKYSNNQQRYREYGNFLKIETPKQ